MENFVYEYPTKVYFGKGAAGQHLPGWSSRERREY